MLNSADGETLPRDREPPIRVIPSSMCGTSGSSRKASARLVSGPMAMIEISPGEFRTIRLINAGALSATASS